MISLTIHTLQVIQVIFLFLAGFFSIETVNAIHEKRKKNKKHRLHNIRFRIFPFLVVGIIALTIAFTVKHVYSYIYGDILPLASDIFFVISYFTLIIAFIIFWIDTTKLHKMHKKEPIFMVGVVAMVVIWLYFLFVRVIGSGTQALPQLNYYLTYFYPAAAAFLFFTTLIVYPRYKAGIVHTPWWYLSSAVFLNFLAEMMYVYTNWNLSMEFIEVLYSILFMFSALYFMLGFYQSYKKYRN